jgi:hypothetical protein
MAKKIKKSAMGTGFQKQDKIKSGWLDKFRTII